jgi:hypothetical protein
MHRRRCGATYSSHLATYLALHTSIISGSRLYDNYTVDELHETTRNRISIHNFHRVSLLPLEV